MPPEMMKVQMCSYLSVSKQAAPAPVTEQMIQKTKPVVPTESSNLDADTVSPPKVDYATDLFNMLSIDGSVDKAAGAYGDDNTWAGFHGMPIFAIFFFFSFFFLFLFLGLEPLKIHNPLGLLI